MRDPARVVRLEWRKVRRPESKGLTSHSWLQARALDGKLLRLEIYSDRGYTERIFDPFGRVSPGFFDRDSIIYGGHVAESQDFVRPLTSNTLRQLAHSVAESRPYSISEFNCHHFVMQVWNAVVIETLRATHYPDRAKTGILWGLEGALGSWLGGIGSSLAAPQDQDAPEAPEVWGAQESCESNPGDPYFGKFSGILEPGSWDAVTGDRCNQLASFCRTLAEGRIFALEQSTQGRRLVQTAVPAHGFQVGREEDLCAAWTATYLPGVKTASIGPLIAVVADMPGLLSEVYRRKDSEQCVQPGPLHLAFASLASESLASHEEAEDVFVREPISDSCFVVFRDSGALSEPLRMAAYAVLRPVATPTCAWRLRLWPDTPLFGSESEGLRIQYWIGDLPEFEPTTKAVDVAKEDLLNLPAAKRSVRNQHQPL